MQSTRAPRRPGRPPLSPDEGSVKICLTVPTRKYDALDAQAREERVSIPELVRRSLNRRATPNDDDE
jgi:hypothetical protein